MEHVASSCLIFFTLVKFFIAMPFATGFSLTKGNSYLAHYVIKTLFVKDWISCTLACQVEEMCVSYNYNTITRACDLNVEGIHEPLTGANELVKMHGVVFHQIKVRISRSPLHSHTWLFCFHFTYSKLNFAVNNILVHFLFLHIKAVRKHWFIYYTHIFFKKGDSSSYYTRLLS